MRLDGCTITRSGGFKGGSWMIENRRVLYIACRIEAHCLAVRTAQILPPSPPNADISPIYTYAKPKHVRLCTCKCLRVVCSIERVVVNRWDGSRSGKWRRVEVFLTKLSTIVTPLTRGGGNDESWPRDFHDNRGSGEISDGNSIIPSGSRYGTMLKNYRPMYVS